MRSAQRSLRIAVPGVLAMVVVEAVVSIAARWPHQFAGHGRPDQVGADFVAGGGTALAPPLWLVVLLAVVALGVHAGPRRRIAATALLLPVAAVLTVGALGEALATAGPDVPRAAQLAGGVVGVALSLLLLVLACVSLAEAWRRRGVDRSLAPAPLGATELAECAR
jgi:uncharacterized membrane protein